MKAYLVYRTSTLYGLPAYQGGNPKILHQKGGLDFLPKVNIRVTLMIMVVQSMNWLQGWLLHCVTLLRSRDLLMKLVETFVNTGLFL
jgi:hypothetical protein